MNGTHLGAERGGMSKYSAKQSMLTGIAGQLPVVATMHVATAPP